MKPSSIVLVSISSILLTSLLYFGYTRIASINAAKRERIYALSQSTPPILSGVVLHNEKNDPISIGDIITGNTFVYYIPNGSCPPCVEKDLLILDTLKMGNRGMEVLIISNLENIRLFQLFSMQNKRDLPLYNSKEGLAKFGIGGSMRPIYFIIDKNLEVTGIFQSNPEVLASHSYFRRVAKLLTKQ